MKLYGLVERVPLTCSDLLGELFTPGDLNGPRQHALSRDWLPRKKGVCVKIERGKLADSGLRTVSNYHDLTLDAAA